MDDLEKALPKSFCREHAGHVELFRDQMEGFGPRTRSRAIQDALDGFHDALDKNPAANIQDPHVELVHSFQEALRKAISSSRWRE